jgi:hypothetical protein
MLRRALLEAQLCCVSMRSGYAASGAHESLIWRVVCQPGRVSFSPIALVFVGVEVGWVGGGPGAVRDVGQPDMRGSGWPQDHDSSWGAAVYGIERDP